MEPLWTVKAETASRTRGRIESVLDWARVRGYRSGENPARWRGHLDHLLPARSKVAKVKHHEALPFADVPEFMSRLRARDSLSARALELTILTGARTGEIVGAKWSEIDLTKRIWIVPPGRMKAGREHRVSLAERAVGILTGLPRESGSEFVFIGARAARPSGLFAQPQSDRAAMEVRQEDMPVFTILQGFWHFQTSHFKLFGTNSYNT